MFANHQNSVADPFEAEIKAQHFIDDISLN